MKKEIVKFLILLMVAAGAGPAGAAIWNWSTTASNNATADASINWAEGMAPSAVNDSARAMMAVLAAWRSDISGANTTTGTSTAYALATLEGVNTTPSNGQMLSFIAHTTSGASPTLTVDGGTTYPLWLNGVAAPTGTLVANTPYRVAFSASSSAWLLEAGYGNPYSIPLGGVLWSTAPTAPNSAFVAPSGQCISTTTYAAYWVQQGSPASGGCPGGQFAIIDMRGRVAAGLDTLNASAANRMTSNVTGCGVAFTSIGAVCGNESQTLTAGQSAVLSYSTSFSVLPNQYGPTTILSNVASTSGISVWASPTSTTSQQSIATGGTLSTTSNAGGNPHPIVQPTIGLIPYLRIL